MIVRTGPMLIDPVVAAQLPHFSHSSLISPADKATFEALWARGVPTPTFPGNPNPPGGESDFDKLAGQLTEHSHLRFRWPNWME